MKHNPDWPPQLIAKPKIMIRLMIFLVASGFISELKADDRASPPEMWRAALRNDAQLIWDDLRKNDGKVTASEVIEWMFKNNPSHDDQDSQVDAAFCLIQLADDPLDPLRKMMSEEKPERRAYAIRVASILGDTRLTDDIKRLISDDAKLGFEGEWDWDSVGVIAKQAFESLSEGGMAARLRAQGAFVAAWVPPTKK